MLKALSVRNYVLIDSLEIDFPEGLIIITGQTGAGKSIILGALSLLMGAKADAEAIAEGAETCSVEAEFETEGDAELLALLKENDLGEGGSLILRRVVNRSGRSRAFVNDIPVNLPLLTAVAGRLVDIHSQHQNLLLADHRFQLSALDLYAGNGELLEICRKAHSDLVALRSELSEVSARLASLSAERDYNESVFRRLDSASLKDGELEELEAEQERLANAEDIKENLCLLESFFSPGDDTPSPDAGLRNCVQILSRLSRFLPEVGPLQERLSSARIEIADIAGEVASLNSRFEVSMDRLQAVEERLSTIYGLLKTYSCRTVSELIALKDKYSDALFDSDSLEMRKEELEKAVAAATARLDGVSAQLHAARMIAAGPFSEAIMDSLRSYRNRFSALPFLRRRPRTGRTLQMRIGRRALSYNAESQGHDGTLYRDAHPVLRRDRLRRVRQCCRPHGLYDMRHGTAHAGLRHHPSAAGRGKGQCALSRIKIRR